MRHKMYFSSLSCALHLHAIQTKCLLWENPLLLPISHNSISHNRENPLFPPPPFLPLSLVFPTSLHLRLRCCSTVHANSCRKSFVLFARKHQTIYIRFLSVGSVDSSPPSFVSSGTVHGNGCRKQFYIIRQIAPDDTFLKSVVIQILVSIPQLPSSLKVNTKSNKNDAPIILYHPRGGSTIRGHSWSNLTRRSSENVHHQVPHDSAVHQPLQSSFAESTAYKAMSLTPGHLLDECTADFVSPVKSSPPLRVSPMSVKKSLPYKKSS